MGREVIMVRFARYAAALCLIAAAPAAWAQQLTPGGAASTSSPNTWTATQTFASGLKATALSAGTIVGGGYLGLDSGNNVVLGAGGAGITQLTGPVTAGPGSGSQAATITATGVTAGTYGDATHVPQCTYNAAGQATACSNIATGGGVTPAWVEAAAALSLNATGGL